MLIYVKLRCIVYEPLIRGLILGKKTVHDQSKPSGQNITTVKLNMFSFFSFYFYPFFNCFQRWDSGLAAMAQRWADQCIYEHGGFRGTENTSGFPSAGQNLAVGYGSIDYRDGVVATNGWHAEEADYTYDAPCESGKVCGYCQPGKPCGHYTQVRLWSNLYFRLCRGILSREKTNSWYCVQKEIGKIARAVMLWHEVNQSNIPLCNAGSRELRKKYPKIGTNSRALHWWLLLITGSLGWHRSCRMRSETMPANLDKLTKRVVVWRLLCCMWLWAEVGIYHVYFTIYPDH